VFVVVEVVIFIVLFNKGLFLIHILCVIYVVLCLYLAF
jgi:hypothetical protein